ncbi:MAG: DNA/RNA nuclease SfsA, partial [Spirochaetaceae bacterium]|nr:DNA/RNA nuclease SfsA [Spirochaetaceae bacterium]
RANEAAEKLILPTLIPGLTEVHREYTVGDSRFDFLCIDSEGTRHLIEVKACSLVEHNVAMFPDAPSSRALKHLEELAHLAKQGALAEQSYQCHILFVIVHGTPSVFIPNLHTDPHLSAALYRYSDRVHIHAALIRCNSDGMTQLLCPSIPIDLSHGTLAEENRGSYLIVLEIPCETEITVGALGTIRFQPGWYVYAGSAQRNLSSRIARHLRKVRKQKHWHLDYLTPEAKTIKAFPIYSYQNLECALAENLTALGGILIEGFGSSDCRCESHLFHFPYPPGRDGPDKGVAFADMLFHFRHIEAFKQ